ncbi:hypothetical protein HPB50_023265 [Hyalomma asiaticum]|uniref:Uncharacterized protein n=1 Tax=Hyalomma asiaticum TaxID=266040 RepID=A0ACB7SEX5_HYAAI|nr:hypothetical protein HPB50_023265 [Hyalomma asiaticum]
MDAKRDLAQTPNERAHNQSAHEHRMGNSYLSRSVFRECARPSAARSRLRDTSAEARSVGRPKRGGSHGHIGAATRGICHQRHAPRKHQSGTEKESAPTRA